MEGDGCLFEGCCETSIRRQAGVGVDLENPWTVFLVDPEINPCISVQFKEMPAFFSQAPQLEE